MEKSSLFLVPILLSIWLPAEANALFGNVTGIPKDDVLNVREQAYYRSKKIASLPLQATVGIDRCKRVNHSTWCKVHHIAQHDYEGFGHDAPSGWVNARYLDLSERGYVLIDGKGHCDYALECRKGKCLVLTNYETNTQHEIVDIKTEWIDRQRLYAQSHFGAASDIKESGYCTVDSYIETYFRQKNLDRLSRYHSGASYKRVIALIEDLRGWIDGKKLQKYIHPDKGVVMTWNVRFGGREDLHFTKEQIAAMDTKKIYWGQTYGKGDDVYMTLEDYLGMMTRDIRDITKIETLQDLKGFTNSISASKQVGYEVFWINEASKAKEYDWLGLVVILEEYQGQWYVVGLLRERWTI